MNNYTSLIHQQRQKCRCCFMPDGIGRNGRCRKKKIPKEFRLQIEKFAYIKKYL